MVFGGDFRCSTHPAILAPCLQVFCHVRLPHSWFYGKKEQTFHFYFYFFCIHWGSRWLEFLVSRLGCIRQKENQGIHPSEVLSSLATLHTYLQLSESSYVNLYTCPGFSSKRTMEKYIDSIFLEAEFLVILIFITWLRWLSATFLHWKINELFLPFN